MRLKQWALALAVIFCFSLAPICLAAETGQSANSIRGDAAAMKKCQSFEKATRKKQKRIKKLDQQIDGLGKAIKDMRASAEQLTPDRRAGTMRQISIFEEKKVNALNKQLRLKSELVAMIKQAEEANCHTTAGGSYKNWLDCWTWCDRNKKRCEFCTENQDCGEGYKRLKAWTGLGRNYYACKKKRFGFRK